MNKKDKNFELKLYELLGVKIFRKMAFSLRNILLFPFTIKMSKAERKENLNSPSNYNMKKGHGLQDLRDFKKELYLNASIHIGALFICLPSFLKIIGVVAETISTTSTIINLIAIGINCYCLMLQRYNWIRISKVLKKNAPREERQKDVIKQELKEQDALLSEHKYKIVKKNKKEQSITLDELLKTATLQQLKEYKEYLEL